MAAARAPLRTIYYIILCAQFRMNNFTVLLALGEKGGELNSKIHSSVKKVVSVLEAQAICRNMNRNLQKCRNAS